jgi:hypothetical protein
MTSSFGLSSRSVTTYLLLSTRLEETREQTKPMRGEDIGWEDIPKLFATFSASSAEKAGSALGVGIPYYTSAMTPYNAARAAKARDVPS